MREQEFIDLLPDLTYLDRVELSFMNEFGGNHVVAWLAGKSKEDCLRGACSILDAVRGQKTFVRIPPEADSQCDIKTQEWAHLGYVRFSFWDEAGEWLTSPLMIERTVTGLSPREIDPVPFIPDWAPAGS